MSESMIERIGDAIDSLLGEVANHDLSDGIHERFARAVLLALREPTEEMIDEGRELMSLGDETISRRDMRAKWQAMIYAALAEDQAPSSSS